MLEKEPAHLVVKERTSRGINAGININMARIRRVKAAAAAEEIKSADRCRAGRSMQAHRSPRTTTMFTDIDCAQDNYARAGSFSAPGHTFCWSSARQNTPPPPGCLTRRRQNCVHYSQRGEYPLAPSPISYHHLLSLDRLAGAIMSQ